MRLRLLKQLFLLSPFKLPNDMPSPQTPALPPGAKPLRPDGEVDSDRRVVWHFGQFLGLFFKISLGINVILGIAVMVLAAGLVAFALRPPIVLDQNSGYLMWRTTSKFVQSPDNVRAFFSETLGAILTVIPGDYRLARISDRVSKNVYELFRKDETFFTEQAIVGRRRVYRLNDARRFDDPKFPQFLVFAVKGEVAAFEMSSSFAAPGFTYDAKEYVHVVYCSLRMPQPNNPYGLFVEGISTKVGAEAQGVWERAFPLEAEDVKADRIERLSEQKK